MNSLRSLIAFTGLVATLCALCDGAVPQIPCSFTADMKFHFISGGQTRDGRCMYYSLEGVGVSMVGDTIMQSYPGNSTIIMLPPNTIVIINPFVNHKTCASLPIPNGNQCIGIPPDAKLVSQSLPCVFNPNYKCDQWEWSEDGLIYDVFLRSDTTEIIVDQMTVQTDGFLQEFNFVSISPVPPPRSMLEIPKDQPCSDYTENNSDANALRESLFEVSPLLFGFPVIKKKNNPVGDMFVNDPKTLEWTRRKMNPDAKWKVGPSPYFNGLTFRDVANMLQKPEIRDSDHQLKIGQTQRKRMTVAADIPTRFDAREQWPQCGINKIRDQGQCGSCWAFSSSEEFADRICIAKNSSEVVVLSPQYMIDCYSLLNGCGGGYIDISHAYMRDIGVPLESCVPYTEQNQPSCEGQCADGSSVNVYKMSEIYDMYKAFDVDTTVRLIQTEIMARGPVTASFYVFSDFSHYAGGIYARSKTASYLGAHAVKIVGWDEENGTPYWIIANSWGDKWGENGFFRIIRGQNDCSIEDATIAGTPAV